MQIPITHEEMIRVLSGHANIAELSHSQHEGTTFDRYFRFSVNGTSYMIEWWKNVSYLHVGPLKVLFDHLALSDTWPNCAKVSLQFYYRGETVAILPVELWSDPKEEVAHG